MKLRWVVFHIVRHVLRTQRRPTSFLLPPSRFFPLHSQITMSQTFHLKGIEKGSLFLCFCLWFLCIWFSNFLFCVLLRLLNLKMSVNRRNWLKHGGCNLRLVILVMWLVCYVGNGQTIADTSEFNNPAVLPLVTQMVYRSLSNSTAALNRELGTRAKFCVKDPSVFFLLDYILALSLLVEFHILEICITSANKCLILF